MTTEATLTSLIIRHHTHPVLSPALLDSLYAIRRITWTPTPRELARKDSRIL